MSATYTYTISGMTCSHCVSSVREEIEALPGVEHVEVDLDRATAVVGGDVDAAAVAAAVAEAGYSVTGYAVTG